ncbi:NERD nuclease [Acidiferrobacter sp. SPIII_3]|jgi:hypothetical protein|uniref:ATP-binding domain-containing protein n=1 Tax=Acidiferrobacter sp. SPIII_3 TaxID=1281578 RepID=UPI000D73D516|nr:ATP-binding domain-containing protein [Acidiferrobacter sp. SPIII_3]AWP22819.1 NERD nuclease [Acidiferrobacter sp. SPIII_3]
MATLRPSLEGQHAVRPGEQREFDVLRQLEAELPADFTIFHGVMWSSVHDGVQWFGECDAIVLAPNGSLVILEVKAGAVEWTSEGLRKRYGDRTKDIGRQARVQYAALRQRLQSSDLHVHVAHILVLADQVVGTGSIGYPRERIVDADEMPDLARRVQDAIPAAATHAPTNKRMSRFLDDVFDLGIDAGRRIEWLKDTVTRLSDGLATWVPRITSPSGVFRIEATAGSGKTQLALRLLQEAVSHGHKAQYVCYHRPLADRMREIGPGECGYATFHELALASLRGREGRIDFADSDLFARAAALYSGSPGDTAWSLLVIDEAQDFDAEWIASLRRQMASGGRAYILGDADQQMRPATAGAWADAVTLRCMDNFRNPRRIVQCINALGLASSPLTARGPVDGDLPGFHIWAADDAGGLRATEDLIAGLIAEGLAPDHMVVLSGKGRRASAVVQKSTLADITLRRFTGSFDPSGRAIWTEGALVADTIARFKGQSAPVVILAELDFPVLDAPTRRLLFTGMTRAQWRLECVMSARTEELLMEALA